MYSSVNLCARGTLIYLQLVAFVFFSILESRLKVTELIIESKASRLINNKKHNEKNYVQVEMS